MIRWFKEKTIWCTSRRFFLSWTIKEIYYSYLAHYGCLVCVPASCCWSWKIVRLALLVMMGMCLLHSPFGSLDHWEICKLICSINLRQTKKNIFTWSIWENQKDLVLGAGRWLLIFSCRRVWALIVNVKHHQFEIGKAKHLTKHLRMMTNARSTLSITVDTWQSNITSPMLVRNHLICSVIVANQLWQRKLAPCESDFPAEEGGCFITVCFMCKVISILDKHVYRLFHFCFRGFRILNLKWLNSLFWVRGIVEDWPLRVHKTHGNWVVTPTCNPQAIFGDLANRRISTK